jgi:hypothetical protein
MTMVDPKAVDQQLVPRKRQGADSVADSDQRSKYSSTSHHSLHNTSRQVISTVDLTHEMAEIKEQLAGSANIRADAQR